MPSFSAAQSARFSAQGARERRQTSATAILVYEGKRLCVSRTGIDHRREIASGPFEAMPEAVVRVDMAAYSWFLKTEAEAFAAVGAAVTLDGVPLKITTAKRLPLAGEIVLSLGKA